MAEEVKQYFCDELNNVLSCFHDRIMSCCTGQLGPSYFEAYKGEKIDFNTFFKVKEEAFKLLNSRDIDKTPCKGCYYLREKKETDIVSPQFKVLNVSHWTQCNCGCIYCARMFHSEGKISTWSTKSSYYDFLPLLKKLYEHNILDKENLFVCIQGGDISVLKEFKPMMQEFIKSGYKEFCIFTNNIVFQPMIKTIMDKNPYHISLTTALDAGCRETYKKIKRVDKFNDCVNNLRKYMKNNNDANLVVKYIVVENLNDNVEEITKFINLMADIGIRTVEFAIDHKWTLFTNLEETPFPTHYGNLYLKFKQLAEEKGLAFQIWPKSESIIKQYALK